MKVAVLGSGVVGQTLAQGFLKHGHEVMLGTRDPGSADVQSWLAKTPGPKAGTFATRGPAISPCSQCSVSPRRT